jgi:Mg-chelatase subunit ChlD
LTIAEEEKETDPALAAPHSPTTFVATPDPTVSAPPPALTPAAPAVVPAPGVQPLSLTMELALTAGVLCLVVLAFALVMRWQEGKGLRHAPLVLPVAVLAGGCAVAALGNRRWTPAAALVAAALTTTLLLPVATRLAWSSAPPEAQSPPTPPAPPPPKPAPPEVMVVLESSPAMQPFLEGVKKDLLSFAGSLLAQDPAARVGLLTFHQRIEKAGPAEIPAGPSPFTRKPELFSQEVGKLKASGGGDIPESSLDALALAGRQPFRDDADKVLILITDAPPHVPDKEMQSVAQTLEHLRGRKIKQLHLLLPEFETSYRHRFKQYEELQVQVPGLVFPLAGNATAFAQLLPQVGQQIADLTIGGKTTPGAQPKADILFLLDITSSMGAQINGVKQGISSFANELFQRKLDARIGLIGFRDQFVDKVPFTVLKFNPEPGKPGGQEVFTRNPAEFGQKVGQLKADGGGDEPESSMDALDLGSRQPFRPEADKIIILITDASPKIPDKNMKSVKQTADLLKQRQIKQLHVIAPATLERRPTHFPEFEELQRGIPGRKFPLAADETAFGQLLPQVGQQIAETSIQARGLAPGARRLKVDVLFVLDITGSMQPQINGVKRGISAFADELLRRKLDARVGLLGFRDQMYDKEVFRLLDFPGEPVDLRPAVGPVRVPELSVARLDDGPLTHRLDGLARELNRLSPAGDGAGPQSSLDALALAAGQPFRPEARKMILFVAASPPATPDREMLSATDVVDELVAKDVRQVQLVVPAAVQRAYKPLLAATPGRVTPLEGPHGLEQLLKAAAERPPAPPPPAPSLVPAAPAAPVLSAGPGVVVALVAVLAAMSALVTAAWLRPFDLTPLVSPGQPADFWSLRGALLASQVFALMIGVIGVLI